MNTFEVAAIAFVVGIVVGVVLEWKYGAKAATIVTKAEGQVNAVVTDVKKDV